MLVISRALMSRPKADPARRAFARAGAALRRGDLSGHSAAKQERQLTIVLVEQNAALALEVADHGYVMENGRVVLEGPAEMLRHNSDVKEFYLGLNELDHAALTTT